MEEARHWVWEKRKHGLSSHLQALPTTISSSQEESWEEQAFAEDAAGPLGGCIWPPRSYSCSFCRREFRSAQALGGHMNVHRRDRARLKQSPDLHHREIPNHDHFQNHHNNNPLQIPFSSLSHPHQHPSQVCALLYKNPNPNSDPAGFIPSPSSPSKQEKALFSPYSSTSSPLIQQHGNKRSNSSTLPFAQSWSNLATERFYQQRSNQSDHGGKISSITVESGSCRAKGDFMKKADLSVSLNLVLCRACPTLSDEAKEEALSFKRRRITESSSILSPLKQSSPVTKHEARSEVFENSPRAAIDDLDLELRLGGRPKVK
ncbi:hypothetical protein UlMin_000021 [Ulmus minor]